MKKQLLYKQGFEALQRQVSTALSEVFSSCLLLSQAMGWSVKSAARSFIYAIPPKPKFEGNQADPFLVPERKVLLN
jgi:hypothetical protein